MELLLQDLPRPLPIAGLKDDLGERAKCSCCALLMPKLEIVNRAGCPDTPRLAVAGWRSVLPRNLSGCLLLCLFHLRRRGQGSLPNTLLALHSLGAVKVRKWAQNRPRAPRGLSRRLTLVV